MANPFLLDPDSLTLGEYAAIEEITDWTLPEIIVALSGEGVLRSAQFVLALTLIAGTRDDPEYTLEDAAKVKLVDLDLGDTDGDAT